MTQATSDFTNSDNSWILLFFRLLHPLYLYAILFFSPLSFWYCNIFIILHFCVTSFIIYSTLIKAKDNTNMCTSFITCFFEETLPTMIHYSYYLHDFTLNDSSRECIAVQIRFNAAPLDNRDARTQSK